MQPKYVSPVDPAARWSAADRGEAHFLYSANYLVDLANAVIVDVEVTAPIRQAKNRAARDMIALTLDRFGFYPARLVADTACGSAETLARLVLEQGIEPHIPVIDKARRGGGTLSRDDFFARTPIAVQRARGSATIDDRFAPNSAASARTA